MRGGNGGRLEPDPIRGPVIAKAFKLHAEHADAAPAVAYLREHDDDDHRQPDDQTIRRSARHPARREHRLTCAQHRSRSGLAAEPPRSQAHNQIALRTARLDLQLVGYARVMAWVSVSLDGPSGRCVPRTVRASKPGVQLLAGTTGPLDYLAVCGRVARGNRQRRATAFRR